MYYSDDIINDIASRVDIVDIINERVGLKKKGKDYECCCPFHTEKTPSFKVHQQDQYFYCFGCGAGGSVYTFLERYEGYSFPEAIEYLAERTGYNLPKGTFSGISSERAEKRKRLYEINRTAAAYYHYILTKTEAGRKGYDYFTGRGISSEIIGSFGLGYAPIGGKNLYNYLKKNGFSDEDMIDAGLVGVNEKQGAYDFFWNRVIVPIVDKNNKVIGFGGRVLGDAKPKYINTKETEIYDKGKNLFALNQARRSKRRGFIVCEGYMDVISMHQAGFNNAIASLGTAFTEDQAVEIRKFTNEVYLAYDSDEAGRNATDRALNILSKHDISARIIDLKPYKDPDEFIKNLGVESFQKRIDDAVPGRMYRIASLSDKYSLKDPEEKTRFINEAAAIVAELEDPAAVSSYIESVTVRYGFEKDVFKKKVSTIHADMGERGDSSYRASPVKPLKNDIIEDEALLITWMMNDSSLLEKVMGILTEEDFTEGIYRDTVSSIYKQYNENKTVSPTILINRYEDVDDQQKVSNIINTKMRYETDESRKEAFDDIIRRLKVRSISDSLSKTTDPAQLKMLLAELAKYKK